MELWIKVFEVILPVIIVILTGFCFGKVTNVKLQRGVDKSLDEEALRVVKSFPDWNPGKQRGKAVRVYFTVPINFNLN